MVMSSEKRKRRANALSDAILNSMMTSSRDGEVIHAVKKGHLKGKVVGPVAYIGVQDLIAWRRLMKSPATCSRCGGSVMVLNSQGEPDDCPECK